MVYLLAPVNLHRKIAVYLVVLYTVVAQFTDSTGSIVCGRNDVSGKVLRINRDRNQKLTCCLVGNARLFGFDITQIPLERAIGEFITSQVLVVIYWQ